MNKKRRTEEEGWVQERGVWGEEWVKVEEGWGKEWVQDVWNHSEWEWGQEGSETEQALTSEIAQSIQRIRQVWGVESAQAFAEYEQLFYKRPFQARNIEDMMSKAQPAKPVAYFRTCVSNSRRSCGLFETY